MPRAGPGPTSWSEFRLFAVLNPVRASSVPDTLLRIELNQAWPSRIEAGSSDTTLDRAARRERHLPSNQSVGAWTTAPTPASLDWYIAASARAMSESAGSAGGCVHATP